MSRLSDLLHQVARSDPQLAEDLAAEVKHLAERRAFGLNFERHVPETVELPGRPIRKGDKVRFLPERGAGSGGTDRRLWRVTGSVRAADAKVASLTLLTSTDKDDTETATRCVEDLVVVAEFRDPIYPGLVSTGRLERGSDNPFHTVINAENYHALEALLFTHEGAVDAIYIDPPYNTGNEGWIYNDRYVAADDLYKHSKWLAFMERRLILARRLLKPTGVIIVAIGDDEHHRLRMLMDQIFGIDNFISDVVWQGGRKNDSRYVSNGADYMLIYAFDEAAMAKQGIRWRERKPGVDEALERARTIWVETKGDVAEANKHWRAWLKEFKQRGDTSDAVTRFSALGPGGRPIRTDGNLRSPNPRPNLQYDLPHPDTGKPVRMHANGWRYSKEKMQDRVSRGLIYFGPDETSGASEIVFLDEMDTQVAESGFVRDRNPSGAWLSSILGDRRFPNPKDVQVLARWLGIVAPKDAVILDFFGGSGTTTEAVMRLNAEDGGTRQSILVTNNELSADEAKKLTKQGIRPGDPEWEVRGVFEYVARPRITTVVQGTRPDGSTYSDGLQANVEFFTMTYESRLSVSHNRAFEQIAPLLWLKAGARGSRIDKPSDTFAVADSYAVLFDLDATKAFINAVASSDTIQMVFVVTDDERGFQTVCNELPTHVEPVRLYESYLTNFTINVGHAS